MSNVYPLKTACIDLETTGFSYVNDKVLTIGVAIRDRTGVKDARYPLMDRLGTFVDEADGHTTYRTVINLEKREMFTPVDSIPTARDVIRRYLQDADQVVFHGGSFDLPFLVKLGILSYSQVKDRLFDTLVMARCTAAHNYVALAELIKEFKIEMPPWYFDSKKKRSNMGGMDADSVFKYNSEDVRATLDVFDQIWPLAQEQYGSVPDFLINEGRYVAIIANMRTLGIPIDVPRLVAARRAALKGLTDNTRILISHQMASKNNKDIMRFVKGRGFGLPLSDKDNPVTDEAALFTLPGVKRYSKLVEEPLPTHPDEIAAVVAEIETLRTDNRGLCEGVYALLQVRKYEKQLSTWIDGFQQEMDDKNVVHPLWSVAGTVSDRLTCTEPGAQAIPKDLRMWSACAGRAMLEADYQQAELRYGAAVAGEVSMAEAFARDEDIHLATGVTMYGQALAAAKRNIAKRANFTGFYGGGAQALSEALNIPLNEASVIINLWRNSYKQVNITSKKAEKVWKDRGYLVLAHGKRLYASDDDRKHRIYKAFNQLIQGSIAQIIKKAMLTIDREMPSVQIRGQIHDNLMLDVPLDLAGYYKDVISEVMRDSAPAHVLTNINPPIVMEVDMKMVYPVVQS